MPDDRESPSFWDRVREAPLWVKIVVPVVLLIVVVALLPASEDEDGGGDEATTEAIATEQESALQPQPEADLEDRLADAAEDSDGDNVDAQCFGVQRCQVTYEIEILGIDTDLELVEAQRDVWAEMFSEPTLKSGAIILRGPTTSVGGKESISDILRVDCDRAAVNQIDWDNVDKEGLETLCDWQELVNFD